jgi:two-component sensor histidine kinase
MRALLAKIDADKLSGDEYLDQLQARLKGMRDAVAKLKADELKMDEYLDQVIALLTKYFEGDLSLDEYHAAQQTLNDKFGPAEPKSVLADSDPE